MPIVKGFRMAPEKPTCAATYTMHSPTIESYPIEIASGMMMTTKASVSSLIPKMAPNKLNKRMTAAITRRSTPRRRKKAWRSARRAPRRKERMPTSIACV